MKTIIDDKGIETKPGPTGLDVHGALTVNDKPVPTIDEYRNLMRALAFVPDFDQRLHDMQQKINELEEKLMETSRLSAGRLPAAVCLPIHDRGLDATATEDKPASVTLPVEAPQVVEEVQPVATPARKKR